MKFLFFTFCSTIFACLYVFILKIDESEYIALFAASFFNIFSTDFARWLPHIA